MWLFCAGSAACLKVLSSVMFLIYLQLRKAALARAASVVERARALSPGLLCSY